MSIPIPLTPRLSRWLLVAGCSPLPRLAAFPLISVLISCVPCVPWLKKSPSRYASHIRFCIPPFNPSTFHLFDPFHSLTPRSAPFAKTPQVWLRACRGKQPRQVTRQTPARPFIALDRALAFDTWFAPLSGQ